MVDGVRVPGAKNFTFNIRRKQHIKTMTKKILKQVFLLLLCKDLLGPDLHLQGHSQHQSENNGFLLIKYESERLPEPTGGLPDVVHLIKYASLVFR